VLHNLEALGVSAATIRSIFALNLRTTDESDKVQLTTIEARFNA
jgi:hypothetical protein